MLARLDRLLPARSHRERRQRTDRCCRGQLGTTLGAGCGTCLVNTGSGGLFRGAQINKFSRRHGNPEEHSRRKRKRRTTHEHALLSTVDFPDSAWPRRRTLHALRRRFSKAALLASASSMRSEWALASCSVLILCPRSSSVSSGGGAVLWASGSVVVSTAMGQGGQGGD